ncbi:NUDIX domain-containing protein [Kitasatospora sp. NPDC001175]|uniref:NUDIX domain-containing protein n=1 Tax=Kitasatospora sp. NPDC001175 TaxID=3157103 RepID=UPI003CFE7173
MTYRPTAFMNTDYGAWADHPEPAAPDRIAATGKRISPPVTPSQPGDQYSRIRMGCQALIINPQGLVLLVNSDRREGWSLPGGTARDDELPHLAVTRAVRAETGLDLHFSDALIVDITPHPYEPRGVDHVFTAQVTARTAATATIPARALAEVGEIAWVEPDSIPDRCTEERTRRIWSALLRLTDPFAPVYHVDGRPIGV